MRRVGIFLPLVLVGCSIDASGLAPPAGGGADTQTKPTVDASAPRDAGLIEGAAAQDSGGSEDAPVTPPPDAGSDLLVGAWAAEWWNLAGRANGECDSGNLFADNGTIPSTPRNTSSEDALQFPRANHPHWKDENDGPMNGLQKDFCARFTRTITLAAGSYKLTYKRDDGLRVYVDGVRVINDWEYLPTADATKTETLTIGTDGAHVFAVVYRDTGLAAKLSISLVKGT